MPSTPTPAPQWKQGLFRAYLGLQQFPREHGWIARARLLRKASRWLYRHMKCGATVSMRSQGLQWTLDLNDGYFTQSMVVEGDTEPWETKFFLRWAQPGMTVVDLGAHIGWYTLLAARQVGPSGMVLAFEPDPTNFGLLRRNVADNGFANVTLFQQAVAEQPGHAQLALAAGNLGGHHLWDAHQPAAESQLVRVDVTTLDTALAKLGRPVDLIKMDVEGTELKAWHGMQETLRRSPRVRLMVEFYPAALRRQGDSPEALFEAISKAGFQPQRIDESTDRLIPTTLDDALKVCNRGRDYTNLFLARA